MTTLISWMSVDSRGPSAIYVVADSRITWGSQAHRWDSGRKVFAAPTPDVFGYCGDVLFPSLVLGQIIDLVSRGLLWTSETDPEERHVILFKYLQTAYGRRQNAPDQAFTVVHATRRGSEMKGEFMAWRIDYAPGGRGWRDVRLDTADHGKSRVVVTLGSGSEPLNRELENWRNSPQGGTARSLFSAFCDALELGADPLTGGVPQIVSLDRKSEGKIFGFVADGQRYVHGSPISYSPAQQSIEWVDRLFNRISPETLERLSGAQRQVRVIAPATGGLRAFLQKVEGTSDAGETPSEDAV
ncbi:hypothetical protein H7F51_09455 [Novosphingobium flavum]|uniref:Uncharacterized protein n=1 Tax=Novosphingobium flavum TaxID=1778672 RepID=A0A7X1FRQ5_9SPHN|nr:hypothetical protein [Novosphingobium flavum]MBC2665750.1 hypothetical protein [Novosphingobium flavum]